MGRVLIVDDEPANRFMLRVILEEAGYEVDEAGGGHAALERCDESHDALVLDYRMPDLDGLAVAGELRASGWTGPVILYSAYFAAALEERLAGGELNVRLVDKADHDGLIAALRELAPQAA
jgi:CheY-like chemotaxis protein